MRGLRQLRSSKSCPLRFSSHTIFLKPSNTWPKLTSRISHFSLLNDTLTCAQRLYNKFCFPFKFLERNGLILFIIDFFYYIMYSNYSVHLEVSNTHKRLGAQPGKNKTIVQEMQLLLSPDTPVLIRWVERGVKITPGGPTWTPESLPKENSRADLGDDDEFSLVMFSLKWPWEFKTY